METEEKTIVAPPPIYNAEKAKELLHYLHEKGWSNRSLASIIQNMDKSHGFYEKTRTPSPNTISSFASSVGGWKYNASANKWGAVMSMEKVTRFANALNFVVIIEKCRNLETEFVAIEKKEDCVIEEERHEESVDQSTLFS